MASGDRQPERFLPRDPRVEEPYRLTPQLAFRVAVIGFVALGVFAVLFLRLWALQVLSGDKYLARANDNRVRTLRLDAPRGSILDRNGHVLVSNVAGTRLELWPADLPKRWPAERKELRSLAQITGIDVHDMLVKLNQNGDDPLTPVVVQSGLHQDQILYLEEHQAAFPGVQLAKSWLRSYPYQSLAAQVLGYVGQISPGEYKTLKNKGYYADDSIGQAGVEATYDTYLRGRDGQAQLTVDSQGRPTSQLKTVVQPQSGESLQLTLSVGLQRAAEKALRVGIQDAKAAAEPYADGGAIVAMDPNDGSILAMASYPTYQPSIFAGRPDTKKLAPLLNQAVAAKDNFPGLNRAIQVGYPPGSTFKPVTALAAMEEHLMTPYEIIPCTPTFTAYKKTFNNWTPLIDQGMDLETALAESCDTYFYELGKRFYQLPENRGHLLQAWANRFGLGELTGIDIAGETKGLIPTPEWLKDTYTSAKGYGLIDRIWKPGYSIDMAIGQGQMLVTPLQMTRLYAMIANGGKLVTPHLAEDIQQPAVNGQPGRVLRRFGGQQPQPTGVDPTALEFVKEGLLEAAQSKVGTSYGVFGNFPVSIAGKTGTAEKLISVPGYPHPLDLNQSWWCGYGPTDSPSIVVCAVIENGGHGGTAAAPAALKVFEQYFGKSATTTSHPSD